MLKSSNWFLLNIVLYGFSISKIPHLTVILFKADENSSAVSWMKQHKRVSWVSSFSAIACNVSSKHFSLPGTCGDAVAHDVKVKECWGQAEAREQEKFAEVKDLSESEAVSRDEETEDKMLHIIKRMQRRRFQRVNKFQMIMKLQNFKVLSRL